MYVKFSIQQKALKFLHWIFWILVIPFFSHFLIIIKIDGSFIESTARIDYWYAFICVSLVLGLLTFIISTLSLHWDKSNDVDRNYINRFLKQLFVGFLLPLVAITTVAIFVEKFIDQNFIQSYYLTKAFPIIGAFLYFINIFYLTVYLGQLITVLNKSTEKQSHKINNEKLLVYHRGSYVPMSLNEIAMINQIAHINWLITFNDEEYILDMTLKEIDVLLNEQHFFKINRNQIIHKEIVKSFSSGTFGKIEVALKSGKITKVSKDRAKEFRQWLSG
jgi:uncharacterized membrane protein YhaH (DUF805 family)